MRRDRLYVVGTVLLVLWTATTYFLFVHKPSSWEAANSGFSRRQKQLEGDVAEFEKRLRAQMRENRDLLEQLENVKRLKAGRGNNARRDVEDSNKDFEEYSPRGGELSAAAPGGGGGAPAAVTKEALSKSEVLPVLMFACNRPTVSKAIDSILAIREDAERFPLIVSQVGANSCLIFCRVHV